MNENDIQKLADCLTKNLPRQDHDSFASFTNGLRSNWVFVLAIVYGAMWLFNNFTGQVRVNEQQDFKIDSVIDSVTNLANVVESITNRQDSLENEEGTIKQEIAIMKIDINNLKELKQ